MVCYLLQKGGCGKSTVMVGSGYQLGGKWKVTVNYKALDGEMF